MYPTQLHSYLLWRSSVEPSPQALAYKRYTAVVSLIPALMCGIFVYGWYAALVILTCLVAAYIADFICRRFIYRKESAFSMPRDGVYLLTGLLVAMMLPPATPLPLAAAGAVIGVLAGKYLLQVDGMPLLQPAILGLSSLHIVAPLLVLFSIHTATVNCMNPRDHWPILERSTSFETRTEAGVVTRYLRNFFGGDVRNSVDRQRYAEELLSNQPITFEAVHGARPQDLAAANPGQDLGAAKPPYDGLKMILGYLPGTIGASSGLALVLGIGLLIFSRTVSPVLPFFALLTMAFGFYVSAWLSSGAASPVISFGNIPIHLLSGSTLLGIFYFAADPTVAPRAVRGQMYAGILFGLLELFFRLAFHFSDGLILTILAVQGTSFLIDQYLAPPPLATPSSVHIGLSQSSLGRL